MSQSRAVLAAVGLLLLGSSCATGVTHVELRDPFPAGAAAAAATPVTLLAVRDVRPETARIGIKRNTRGAAVGHAALANERPLADLVAEHLTAAFARGGFDLRPGAPGDGAAVAVEVRHLWAEFRPGAWGRRAEAEIELHLGVALGGQAAQAHSFRGTSVAASGAGSSALLDAAVNRAYADLLRAIERDLAGGSLGAVLRSAR